MFCWFALPVTLFPFFLRNIGTRQMKRMVMHFFKGSFRKSFKNGTFSIEGFSLIVLSTNLHQRCGKEVFASPFLGIGPTTVIFPYWVFFFGWFSSCSAWLVYDFCGSLLFPVTSSEGNVILLLYTEKGETAHYSLDLRCQQYWDDLWVGRNSWRRYCVLFV